MEQGKELRIGHGLDFHPLVKGRPLILGGARIPYDKGLSGHSDADALLHALIDALLGAAGQKDLGQRFPDSDSKWKRASSLRLLGIVWDELKSLGWRIVNLDCSIMAEAPRLSPYFDAMRSNIAETLGIEAVRCGLKATSTEGLGFVGRGEGIVCAAVVLLESGMNPNQA